MFFRKYILCTVFFFLPHSAGAEAQLVLAYSQEFATATIAMEASGEGAQGELAVAFVLLNRMKTGRWGSNLASVVLAPKQFSCWNSDDPNRKRLATMKTDDPVLLAASAALNVAITGAKPDPTSGATHYYSVEMSVTPGWAGSGNFVVQIGKHRFYKNVP